MDLYRDNHWEWIDEGTPDRRLKRGRIYHKCIRFVSGKDGTEREYKLGDTVIMNGDNDETWTAQIVELFQAREDDDELRQILLKDTKKRTTKLKYEFMRVTLRWFYNLEDMDAKTLRRSRVPEPVAHEIYFSDHVEKAGYNDVQVIEGRAWLFSTRRQFTEFENNPSDDFFAETDQLKIVRCFVNSKVTDLDVRQLERDELKFLLKYPTTDESLFETARGRLFGSTGAVLKGTGRKRSKFSRKPIDITAELDSLADDDVKLEENIVENKSPKRTRSCRKSRRKIVDASSDDDDDNDHEMTTPPSRPLENDDVQPQQQKPRDLEDDPEVMDLIKELNANAQKAQVLDGKDLESLLHGNEVVPNSNQNDTPKRSLARQEPIIIDELDGLGKNKRTSKKKANPFILPKGDLTDRTAKAKQNRKNGANRALAEKPKNVFKPTASARKSSITPPRKKASSPQSMPADREDKRTGKTGANETIDLDPTPSYGIGKKNSEKRSSRDSDPMEVEMDVIIVDAPTPDPQPRRLSEKINQYNKKSISAPRESIDRDRSAKPKPSVEPDGSNHGKDSQPKEQRVLKRRIDADQEVEEIRKRVNVDWDVELDNVLSKFSTLFHKASAETQGAVEEGVDFIVQNLLEKFSSYSDGRIADIPDHRLNGMVKDVLQQLVNAS